MNDDGLAMTPGTPQNFTKMLEPPVEIAGIIGETDREKINAVVFELYKEALTVVNLSAHLLDGTAHERGGWERDQAICAGLLIRICKFMLGVTELSATRNRMEIVSALNRSIMESAINLDFLVSEFETRHFDRFVKCSLAPERELYDLIEANILERGGDVWEIEKRMLASIDDLCQASGVKIEDIERKNKNWAGTVRDRLKKLGKEELYVTMQRLPSHAVHGSWVDLYKNHLEHEGKETVFRPDSRFSNVDARALAPVATLVLDAIKPYLIRFFGDIPDIKFILERIDDLRDRLLTADSAHEAAMKPIRGPAI